MKNLTKKQLKVCFRALILAAESEEGYSAAYHDKGPESKKALANAKKYRNLRVVLGNILNLDNKTPLQKIIDDPDTVELTLSEIKKRKIK